MDLTILVDFGMTASAAECFVTAPNDDSRPIGNYKFPKTPTKLLYGTDDNVVAWGADCPNSKEVRKGFKEALCSADLLLSHGNSLSDLRAQKPVSDYLECFGRSILDKIIQSENITMEKLNVKWYLTAPGCWSDSIQLDFKMVAEQAFSKLTPSSQVFLDLNFTESVASCEFLVDHLDLHYGTWAITCDVGGLTCDMALAVVQQDGGRNIPEVFAISSSTSTGVSFIDTQFRNYLADYLFTIDGGNTDAPELVADLVESSEWQRARHAFDGSGDVTLITERDLGEWKDPSGKISFDGSKIIVPCHCMEDIFHEFLNPLWAEIDRASESVKQKCAWRAAPNVIAMCGGGGTMKYLLKMLKIRYEPAYQIKSPSTTEESCLATIAGHRIHRQRCDVEDYLNRISLGVSNPAEPPYNIHWKDDAARITTFEFSSRREKVRHYVVVHLKSCQRSRPVCVDILKKHYPSRWKGILIWALDVTLNRHLFRGKKYCIEVTCTGTSIFSFRAYDAKVPSTSFRVSSDTYFLED